MSALLPMIAGGVVGALLWWIGDWSRPTRKDRR